MEQANRWTQWGHRGSDIATVSQPGGRHWRYESRWCAAPLFSTRQQEGLKAPPPAQRSGFWPTSVPCQNGTAILETSSAGGESCLGSHSEGVVLHTFRPVSKERFTTPSQLMKTTNSLLQLALQRKALPRDAHLSLKPLPNAQQADGKRQTRVRASHVTLWGEQKNAPLRAPGRTRACSPAA